MTRRGFTLVELLVAMGAASLLIVLLYTALIHYFRAFTREDEIIERSRRTQEILSILRDDVARADGGITKVDDVPEAAVRAVGFEGSVRTLLTAVRTGQIVLNAYQSRSSDHPSLSKRYVFAEVWTELPDGSLVLDGPRCRFTGDSPPEPIRKVVGPAGYSSCVLHVPVPTLAPKSDYWVLRKVVNGTVTPIVWAFHRDRHGGYPAGTLLRYAAGLTNVGGDQLDSFALDVTNLVTYIAPNPPRRPLPTVFLNRFMVSVGVAYGRTKVREGPDPGFSDDTTIVVGP
jgi:prepilin-type N-terminal cleavage/methylation domain-containing protein